jgi:very-short-patch-repair endonuclease
LTGSDRDKALAEADAKHREFVADDSVKRQTLAEHGIDLMKKLIIENTELTKQVDALTREIHGKVVPA